jgi:hypothetical protein
MPDDLRDRVVKLLGSVRRNPKLDLVESADNVIRMVNEAKAAIHGVRLPCVRRFTPKLGTNVKGTCVGTKEMSDQGDEILARRKKPSPPKKKGKKKP